MVDMILTGLAVIAIFAVMIAAGVYFVKKAWFLLPLLIGMGLVYHGLKEMGAEKEPILYVLGGAFADWYLSGCLYHVSDGRSCGST